MNYEFLFRISICFLLSFFVGLERQYTRRIMGLRTTILVSIGSFLFVTFSFSVGASDISRIASQVVAGMGFLGAGAILKDGKKIRGLTTAATLWCDAAIGILCAGGAIYEAVIGTILILFANIFLRYINVLVNNLSGNRNLLCEYNLVVFGNSKILDKIKKEVDEYFKKQSIEINSVSINNELIESKLNYVFIIKKNDIKRISDIEEIITKSKYMSFSITKIAEAKIDEFDD